MSKSRRHRSRVTPPRRRRASAGRVALPGTATARTLQHYNERLHAVTPALYPRAFTARRLNVSIATVLRLEQQGVLTPIRLNRASTAGAVYHRSEQVERLAGGEEA